MNFVKVLREKIAGLWSRKGRQAKKVVVVLVIEGKEFSRAIFRSQDSRD